MAKWVADIVQLSVITPLFNLCQFEVLLLVRFGSHLKVVIVHDEVDNFIGYVVFLQRLLHQYVRIWAMYVS